MLDILNQKQFYWTVANDDNRIEDAYQMRLDFINSDLYDADIIPFDVRRDMREPSVLEVLIAMCIRIEQDIMSDPEYGDRTPKWFWMIMENMHLDNMTNDVCDEDYVRLRCDILMERKYGRDGDGSIFRSPDRRLNWPKLEMWGQMNEYFAKNW